MKPNLSNMHKSYGDSLVKETEKTKISVYETDKVLEELELSVHVALETYSNVHRGSGYNSMVSTLLYGQAREIILEYLGLNKRKFTVIFCTPRRAEVLKSQIKPQNCKSLSSHDLGLPIGVRALAVKKKTLRGGAPFQTGGGTTKLVSNNWIIWAEIPDKFEAGTPSIINIIMFAKALRLSMHLNEDASMNSADKILTSTEILYHDALDMYKGRELLNELRNTLIGHNVTVPTTEGTKSFVNLDNSASTPTFEPIWNTFRSIWRQPSQSHEEIIHDVKLICARVLGAPLSVYDVIFTSNTTEAINITAESFRLESEKDIQPFILNTSLEHSSNDLPWRMVPNCTIIRLTVDTEGFINLTELDVLLAEYNQMRKHGNKRIKIVAMSGASNVLGACNNILEISQIVHRYGARLLVDAAQLVAHRKIEMEQCGIDYLAFSGHKVYAPFGTGVLVVRKGLLKFSSDELDLIKLSGEENCCGIAALGKALLILERIGMELINEEEQSLTSRTISGLSQLHDLVLYGIKDPDSPRFENKIGVIVFKMKNMLSNRLAQELAEQGGIGVRYGCHCAHIIIKHILNISPFLERFQYLIQTLFPKVRFPGLVRVSLGIETTSEDIDRLIQILGKISGQHRSHQNRKSASNKNNSIMSKREVQKRMNDSANSVIQRVYSQAVN
jgi:selenocysteine lyase/cysteine desulfurase